MYIIGSRALAAHIPDAISDERKARADFDIMMTVEQFDTWYNKNRDHVVRLIPKSEFKSNAVLQRDGVKQVFEIELNTLPSVEYVCNRGSMGQPMVEDAFGNAYEALPLVDLYSTKKAHIHYPIHFEKNVKDYLYLNNKIKELDLTPDTRYAWIRKKETMKRVKQKTPKLNMTNSEFFSDKHYTVKYYVIHDDIHEAVKHLERPIYEMMKDDLEMAMCSEKLWNSFTHEQRLMCVKEESYVIAFERYILRGDNDYSKAFLKALERVCTTLTSGWFREFALHNYQNVVDSYDHGFVTKILNAYHSNQLKLIDNLSENDVNSFHSRMAQLI